MKRVLRIAAILLMFAGIAAVAGYFIFGRPASVAWADVQNQIRNMHTVSLTATIQMPNKPEMRIAMYCQEPGLARQDIASPQRGINIVDMPKGLMVSLMPDQKMATRMTLTGMDERRRQELLEKQDFTQQFKKMINENATEIGQREINGRLAKGFRIHNENLFIAGGMNIELWVDNTSGQPVEMLMEQSGTKIHYSDFHFNEPLDPAMFSTDIPEAYQVRDMSVNMGPATAEDIVRMLKVWTTARQHVP